MVQKIRAHAQCLGEQKQRALICPLIRHQKTPCLSFCALLLFLSSLAPLSPEVSAHPITFEDGVALSLTQQPGMILWYGNYSLSSSLSVGADYMRFGEEASTLGLGRINYLAKRWLGIGRQGNLYLFGGAGFANWSADEAPNGQEQSWAWMYGLQADFETRRIYTALITRWVGHAQGGWERPPLQALYRFGVAPYLAKTNELQAWFVAQLTRHRTQDGPPTLTLLMRIFMQTAMWELGADTEGRPWLHLMAHF